MDVSSFPAEMREKARHVNREQSMPEAEYRRAAPRKTLFDSLPRRSMLVENTILGVVIVLALYFGSGLFVPLAIAVLLAFALSPLVRFLKRRIMPKPLAVGVVVLL